MRCAIEEKILLAMDESPHANMLYLSGWSKFFFVLVLAPLPAFCFPVSAFVGIYVNIHSFIAVSGVFKVQLHSTRSHGDDKLLWWQCSASSKPGGRIRVLSAQATAEAVAQELRK